MWKNIDQILKKSAVFLDESKLKDFVKNGMNIDEIYRKNWIIDIDLFIQSYDEKF